MSRSICFFETAISIFCDATKCLDVDQWTPKRRQKIGCLGPTKNAFTSSLAPVGNLWRRWLQQPGYFDLLTTSHNRAVPIAVVGSSAKSIRSLPEAETRHPNSGLLQRERPSPQASISSEMVGMNAHSDSLLAQRAIAAMGRGIAALSFIDGRNNQNLHFAKIPPLKSVISVSLLLP